MNQRRHRHFPGYALACAAALLSSACSRSEPDPRPAPLPREAARDFEVLERVRQKRAPGEEITRIGQAVEQYQIRFGQIPENVAALVRTGMLPAEPVPPEGMAYVIDPLTGNVGLLREIDLRLRAPPARAPR